MTNVKEHILREIKARLEGIDARTRPDLYASTVSRVVRGVVDPDETTGLVVLMLTTGPERPDSPTGERKAGGGPTRGAQYRRLPVMVDAWVAMEFLSDAAIVALGADIERAVLADRYMAGHAVNSSWSGTTPTAVTTQGGPWGLLRVEFEILFRTVYGLPATPIPSA